MPLSGRALYSAPGRPARGAIAPRGRAPNSIRDSSSFGAGKAEPMIVPMTALPSASSPVMSAANRPENDGKTFRNVPSSFPDLPIRFQKLSAVLGSVLTAAMTACTERFGLSRTISWWQCRHCLS